MTYFLRQLKNICNFTFLFKIFNFKFKLLITLLNYLLHNLNLHLFNKFFFIKNMR